MGRPRDEAQMGEWGEVRRKGYEQGGLRMNREGERSETPEEPTANRKWNKGSENIHERPRGWSINPPFISMPWRLNPRYEGLAPNPSSLLFVLRPWPCVGL